MVVTQPPPVSSQEWQWVKGLIEDVVREESRETFSQELAKWVLVVRQFRKAEMRHIVVEESPSTEDLHYHAQCLHLLLAVGHSLVQQALHFRQEELAPLGVRREDIAAFVAELELSLTEWHHNFSEAELQETREKIFGSSGKA